MPVPQHLRDHAGLEKEAVLIGVEDHLELWSKDAWRAFQDMKEAEYKEMASQLFVSDEQEVGRDLKGDADDDCRSSK